VKVQNRPYRAGQPLKAMQQAAQLFTV